MNMRLSCGGAVFRFGAFGRVRGIESTQRPTRREETPSIKWSIRSASSCLRFWGTVRYAKGVCYDAFQISEMNDFGKIR